MVVGGVLNCEGHLEGVFALLVIRAFVATLFVLLPDGLLLDKVSEFHLARGVLGVLSRGAVVSLCAIPVAFAAWGISLAHMDDP